MKAIYKNIALAALALSAVACTQEEDFAPSFLNDPDAVRITAQVATGDVTGGFTRSNPLGTAEQQAKFNNGDAIAVTANGQAAVTYTLNGTTWTPEEGKYLKWVDNSMNFTAWYPVGEGTDANTFNVPTEYADVNAMAAADYMVYTGTQNKTSGNGVTLTMNRKMARIVITPVLNDEFPETNYSITGIKVHANTSGYANGESQTGDIQVSALKQGNVYYALLAPTTAADATFLTVTVTDGTTPKDLIVKGIPATAAGQSYDYTLTVGKDKATIGNVKVNPWTDGTEIANGEKAEEIKLCNLPTGANFRDAVKTFLTSHASLTQIKFIAEPTWTPEGTQIEESGAYMVANGTTLEIRTDAKVFMFHADCEQMFCDYSSIAPRITSIDFNGCINTSNVTNLDWMFQHCRMLTSLDLTGFNTANVTSLKGMFDYCNALQNITFGNSFSTNKVTVMDYVFRYCSKLTSLDLTGFSFNDNLTTEEMFYYTGGNNITERIPIKVTETGYNFLKDKTDTKIQYSNAKYVKPDGVTPWETSTP